MVLIYALCGIYLGSMLFFFGGYSLGFIIGLYLGFDLGFGLGSIWFRCGFDLCLLRVGRHLGSICLLFGLDMVV